MSSGALTFVAAGGVPPYTFTIATPGSGSPAIDKATGAYTAGTVVGKTDVVRVTDSAAVSATAKVNVIAAVTNVDYTVSSATLPTTGNGGTALANGYSFTVTNVGTAGGTKSISWWVFLDSSQTLGSSAILLENGTVQKPIAVGASRAVSVSWTWPILSGTSYLFVLISAADDLNPTNNIFADATPVSVNPPDYAPAAVTAPATAVAGSPLSGTFTLQNIGTQNGSQTVYWFAYVSTKNTLDGTTEKLLATGTHASLGAGASQPNIAFSGTWPSTPGTYYLIVKVSASDDVNPANDSTASSSVSVTAPDVDAAPDRRRRRHPPIRRGGSSEWYLYAAERRHAKWFADRVLVRVRLHQEDLGRNYGETLGNRQ